MLKEIWKLIKMLFRNKPSSIYTTGHLNIITMKHFPFSDYRYMMWCGNIITREEKSKVIERFMNTYRGKVGYHHECIHAIQAETEHGDNWVRFYFSYMWHWLKSNPFIKPYNGAYYTNRYEVEAYANEENFSYLKQYNRLQLRTKYTIKNARKIFNKLGVLEWKKYIKRL